jgi:hypothetical protein
LYSATTSSSQNIQTTFFNPNQLVAPQIGPTVIDHKVQNSPEIFSSTVTNHNFKTNSPAKPSPFLKKQTRKTPYNTRSPKKTLQAPPDMPTLTVTLEIPNPSENTHTTNFNHVAQRRETASLSWYHPPKKGPGVSIVCDEPPDETLHSANLPVFNPGYSEISLARTMFKAARKGKNKMVQGVSELENFSEVKGGFAKPPQQP